MQSFEDTTSVTVTRVVTETAKAILVDIDGDEVWVPKSQISDDSEIYSLKSGEDGGTMIVSTWWAEKEGL